MPKNAARKKPLDWRNSDSSASRADAPCGEAHEGDQRVAQRRKQRRIEQAGARGELPQSKSDENRQIENRDAQRLAHSPRPSSAMVRTTSSRSMSHSSSAFSSMAARRGVGPEPGLDDGLDAAGPRAHHHHALRQEHRLAHVVGHEHHGLAEALPQLAQFLLHDLAGLRVERAERLVHQQDRRLAGQHARDGDALLHAAGQPVRKSVFEAAELDHVDEGLRGAPAFRLADAALGQSVFHIAEHGFPGKQREMLEHDAAVRPRLRGSPSPRTRISPAEQGTKPPIMCSSVDLPQPLGPMMETNSPSPIDSAMRSMAVSSRSFPSA